MKLLGNGILEIDFHHVYSIGAADMSFLASAASLLRFNHLLGLDKQNERVDTGLSQYDDETVFGGLYDR